MKTLRAIAFLVCAGTVLSLRAQPADDAAAAKVDASKGEFVVPRVTWRVRNVIGNERLLRWHVGLAGNAFGPLTLAEAAGKVDALSLNAIAASSSQKASSAVSKELTPALTPDELAVVKKNLGGVRVAIYQTENPGADDASLRKLFEFAKALGIETLVVPFDASSASLDALNKLADEFNISVALRGGKPADVMKALTGHGKRVGVAVDTGVWLEQGVQPLEALSIVEKKLLCVNLRDRSAPGASGHDVMFGEGVGNLKGFLLALSRHGARSLTIVLDPAGFAKSYGDVAKSVEAFEAVALPALGYFVTESSRGFPIRGLQNLPADQRKAIETSGTNYVIGHPMMSEMNVNLPPDVRAKIDAALPAAAPAKPKKARKLLVIDACVANMSHNVIPHANYAIEQMGKKTGAYEAIFSNDFNHLKYPAIKQFDAIFLNSTVGELFPDPEVREGLTRFVREGGGIALLHGATYASRNWPEFAEMVGAGDGPHRIQPATLKVEHADSPITKPFPPDFRYSDEYYRFYDTGPTAWLTREKVHVLLSIDLAKTPDFNEGRPPFIRKDNDYPICWIKNYGKGRVFENAMGHTPELFMTPPLAAHVLAGIQFVLGDLEDDTTPSAKLSAKK